MSNSSAYTAQEIPYRNRLQLLLVEGTTVWRVVVAALKQLLLNRAVEQLFQ
jgi:hypothetical protein